MCIPGLSVLLAQVDPVQQDRIQDQESINTKYTKTKNGPIRRGSAVGREMIPSRLAVMSWHRSSPMPPSGPPGH